jgi:hypothetical protein
MRGGNTGLARCLIVVTVVAVMAVVVVVAVAPWITIDTNDDLW